MFTKRVIRGKFAKKKWAKFRAQNAAAALNALRLLLAAVSKIVFKTIQKR